MSNYSKTTKPSGSPPTEAGTLSVILLAFIAAVAISALNLEPTLIFLFVKMGYSEQGAGYIASISILGIAIGSILVAIKAGQWNLKRTAYSGIALSILGYLCNILFKNVVLFDAACFLAGLGGGLTSSAVLCAFAKVSNAERGYSLFFFFQFALASLVAYLLPRILPLAGVNSFFIIMIVIMAAGIYLCSQMDRPYYKSKHISHTINLSKLFSWPALLAVFSFGIYGCANAAFWGYAQLMAEHIGMSANAAGTCIAIASLASMVGSLLVVWLFRWFGPLYFLTGGIVLGIISMYTSSTTASSLTFFISICLFGFAWSLALPFFQAAQARIDRSGSVVSAGMFTNLLGGTIGPYVAAQTLNIHGYSSIMLVTIPMYIITFITITLTIKSKRYTQTPDLAAPSTNTDTPAKQSI